MTRRTYAVAVALGLAGLIPFAVLAVQALVPEPRQSGMLAALIDYAAIILSFIGGMHWGSVALNQVPAPDAGREGRGRLVFGVVVSLIAWGALLLPVVTAQILALPALIAGYLFTVVVETLMWRRGGLPTPLMWLRWGLSATVIAILTTTFMVRALGGSLTF
jgi:hypothetical protein